MNLKDIFQTLKWEYGALKEVAQTVEVSSETVKNVLVNGLESQYKEQIVFVATKKVKSILRNLREEAEKNIIEATERRDKMVALLEELKQVVESDTATA